MDGEPVSIPGDRDVRGTIDWPDADARAVVVACPPHPQFGGDRRDRRLRAVSEALVASGVACLRFDYGPWDGGAGERRDARAALAWARGHFDRAGLFGYSFGAIRALEVAAGVGDGSTGTGPTPDATSALAPDAAAADALARIAGPLQVVYGARDDTVDWRPVVERARELNERGREPPVVIVELSADHHFVGQDDAVAGAVAPFLAGALG